MLSSRKLYYEEDDGDLLAKFNKRRSTSKSIRIRRNFHKIAKE